MDRKVIYITGADGTGKSTHTKLLLKALRSSGKSCSHLWLRFPFLLSYPFLAFSRLRGYSWHEQENGHKHGYWSFQDSLLMREVFPWVYLIDAMIASLVRLRIPLWLGRTIVCERFVLDMLADVMVALNNPGFIHTLPGRAFLRVLPTCTEVIILDLDLHSIRKRRRDLQRDKRLECRIEAFRRIAEVGSFDLVSTMPSVEESSKAIRRQLGLQ